MMWEGRGQKIPIEFCTFIGGFNISLYVAIELWDVNQSVFLYFNVIVVFRARLLSNRSIELLPTRWMNEQITAAHPHFNIAISMHRGKVWLKCSSVVEREMRREFSSVRYTTRFEELERHENRFARVFLRCRERGATPVIQSTENTHCFVVDWLHSRQQLVMWSNLLYR